MIEDIDIERIATAVSEQFMVCPPELDRVLRGSYIWSQDITSMMDFTKEHPASNYRIDFQTSPTMFMLTFSRYGGEIIGRFVFRRNYGRPQGD